MSSRIASSQSTVGSKRSRGSTITRRRRATPSRITRVPMGRQAFPKQLTNTLKYFSQTQVTLNGSAQVEHNFNANGMFDPDQTGIGHQPLYYDQLMAVYNHYTVVRSRIKMVPVLTVSTSFPMTFSISVDDDTNSGHTANTQLALEREGTTWGVFHPNQMPGGFLKNSFDAAKTFGPNPMAQSELQGTVSANPSENIYFIVRVDGNLVAANSDVKFWVEIEYDVIWDELVSMTSS